MKFANFQQFYPFYLQQHSDWRCRCCHYLGSTLVWTGLLYCLLSAQFAGLLLLPVIGYGCAWAGHFMFEKNRPATFSHPGYSFLGDWVMYGKWLATPFRLAVSRRGKSTSPPQHPRRQ